LWGRRRCPSCLLGRGGKCLQQENEYALPNTHNRDSLFPVTSQGLFVDGMSRVERYERQSRNKQKRTHEDTPKLIGFEVAAEVAGQRIPARYKRLFYFCWPHLRQGLGLHRGCGVCCAVYAYTRFTLTVRVNDWDRTRTRLLFRQRVTSLALSVARWVHNSAMATFSEAPRTAGFPRSGLKSWRRSSRLRHHS
jgi:hypothetical protein